VKTKYYLGNVVEVAGHEGCKRKMGSKGLRRKCMRKFQDFCFGSFISGSRICAGGLRIAAGARRSFLVGSDCA
jgi:hypothetical protein